MLLVLLVLSAQCLLTITRYNGSLAALREAVGVEASRALFLERIEKWARAVGHHVESTRPTWPASTAPERLIGRGWPELGAA